jgi:hypothetical protein
MNIFNRLFPSKEVKVMFSELYKAEIEMNNESFEIIKKPVKKIILRDAKQLSTDIKNGKSPTVFIYNLINNVSGDYFESGQFPYRNIFGSDFDKGYYLQKLFEQSIDKLAELGSVTKEYAEKQKNIIKGNMSREISKPLPFL